MDGREEEEEEEASSSCFPREDSCDTGEHGDPGQEQELWPENRVSRQSLLFSLGEGAKSPWRVLNHEIIPELGVKSVYLTSFCDTFV